MKKIALAAVICIVVLSCPGAQAEHVHLGDFGLTVEFDSIIVEPRVLPADLLAEEFFSTDEPGFDSAPGVFPAEAAVGFNILDPLKRWSGSVFEPLLPATEETMIVSFLQRVSQTSSGFVAGFNLPAANDGSWHRHLAFTLSGSALDAPRAGVYLLSLEICTTSSDVKSSYPIYIVFNADSEPDHELALEWVRENLAGPVCVQKIPADLNSDCRVDFQDFALFVDSWLSCNLRPQSECWR